MRNPSCSSSITCRTSCCSNKVGIKRGPWTPEEDEILADYIKREGVGRWRTLPNRAGLLRCGKSCRLRWMNYLRPSVKRGRIAPDEEDLILRLHRLLGNRWALIAGRIPGRTDNEIKNYWNTHLSKKLIKQGIDPRTHKPLNPIYNNKKPNNPSIINNGIIPSPIIDHSKAPKHIDEPSERNLSLEIINHSYDQTLPGMTNLEEVTEKGTSDESLMSQLLMNDYINPNLEFVNNPNLMMTSFKPMEVFNDIDYYDDNMFSSILNSLIDDDVFGNQNF